MKLEDFNPGDWVEPTNSHDIRNLGRGLVISYETAVVIGVPQHRWEMLDREDSVYVLHDRAFMKSPVFMWARAHIESDMLKILSKNEEANET